MKLKSIREIKHLKGKKVLLRVAYDVPLKQNGKKWVVADDRRMIATLPTIKYLLRQQCKIVILAGWLGRPSGKVVEKLKMDPVAKTLSKLIGQPVKKLNDCIGPKVFKEIQNLENGEVILLENTRFHPGEEQNDKSLAKLMVHGLDLVVFDAYAQAHRIHSSTTGITKLLPSYAGDLLLKEIKALTKISKNPRKPLVIILGGIKISDKIGTMQTLVKTADSVLIGGGLANVFLKAKGIPVGQSYLQDVFVDKAKRKKVSGVKMAKQLLKRYGSKIVLPIDLIAGNRIDAHALMEVVDLSAGEKINKQWKFLDIGPKTIKTFLPLIKSAKTIFWNGPMGVFEIDRFSNGTEKIARAIGRSKATSVVGGGDTEVVVNKYHLEGKFSHLSTGGGASLEFLAGKELPALKYIIKK